MTLHRPALVDQAEVFGPVLEVLLEIADQLPLVRPVHSRTRNRLEQHGFLHRMDGNKRVRITDPIGYLDMLTLNRHARMILTDSGGLQEEATILEVPCLTLRPNTERPVTITAGANTVVGMAPDVIRATARSLLAGRKPAIKRPELWDGSAARRICDVMNDNG